MPVVRRFQNLVVGYLFNRSGGINAARAWAKQAFADLYARRAELYDDEMTKLILYECARICGDRAEREPCKRTDGTPDERHAAAMWETLRDLDGHVRLMAVLTYVFGATRADIAWFMGLPESMARRRIESASKALPESFLAIPLSDMKRLRPSNDPCFHDEVCEEISQRHRQETI